MVPQKKLKKKQLLVAKNLAESLAFTKKLPNKVSTTKLNLSS